MIKEFKTNGKVYCSQSKKETRELTAEEVTLVSLLEQKENITIYHTLKINNDTFYLCVDENIREWRDEKIDLKLGFASAKVFNITDKTIGIEMDEGRAKRILI